MSGNRAQVPPGPPDDYHPPLPEVPAIRIVWPPIVPRPPDYKPRTAAGIIAVTVGLYELTVTAISAHGFP